METKMKRRGGRKEHKKWWGRMGHNGWRRGWKNGEVEWDTMDGDEDEKMVR